MIAGHQIKVTSYVEGPSVAPGTTAIIVCHGMGQQVPFDTLKLIADGLLRCEGEAVNATAPEPRVVLLPNGDDYLPRAELQIKGKMVHIYEAYWAPITEGRVTFLDVLSFLFDGALKGIFRMSKDRSFRRCMFGAWQDFPISKKAIGFLFVALLVLIALIVHYAAFAVLAVAWVVRLLSGADVSSIVIDHCLRAWLCVALSLIPSILLFLIASRGGTVALKVLLLWAAVVAGGSLLWTAAPVNAPWRWPGAAKQFALNLYYFHGYLTALILGVWAWLLWKSKTMIVQYPGDVAAYISAHKASKFYEIRDKVQAVGFKVAKFVYKIEEYKRIVIVGHSLGSVIAYDALNAIIRYDGMNGGKINAVDRTKSLITFGSPLDKTAYLFRLQATKEGSAVREALACAVQPLINKVSDRPEKWVNIYSPADIISGSLEYYGEVCNKQDPEATRPLLAHTQYWNNQLLRTEIYNAV